MLHRINNDLNTHNRVLRGLVLLPTRELVEQVSKTFSDFGQHLRIKHTKIMGGVSRTKQTEILASGIEIIVATPGRLQDLEKEDILDLSSVNFIILDEADTMLEMGFIKDIENIFSLCSPYRQIIMCSATVSQNIRKLAKEFLKDPVTVQVHDRRDKVDTISHKAFKVDVKIKKKLVAKIIKKNKYDQILLFVNKKDSADAAYTYFKEEGISVAIIHGDVEYKNRVQAIKDFRAKKAQVLIATDIAARGLDIQDLPLVINYSLPETTDDFTHRVGRTGRAGKKGTVITMLTVDEYNQFTKVERNLKLNVKREIDDDFPLKDRQPRQRIMKKKSLSEKKGYKKKIYDKSKDSDKAQNSAKSKKTTKRDASRNFRK